MCVCGGGGGTVSHIFFYFLLFLQDHVYFHFPAMFFLSSSIKF